MYNLNIRIVSTIQISILFPFQYKVYPRDTGAQLTPKYIDDKKNFQREILSQRSRVSVGLNFHNLLNSLCSTLDREALQRRSPHSGKTPIDALNDTKPDSELQDVDAIAAAQSRYICGPRHTEIFQKFNRNT